MPISINRKILTTGGGTVTPGTYPLPNPGFESLLTASDWLQITAYTYGRDTGYFYAGAASGYAQWTATAGQVSKIGQNLTALFLAGLMNITGYVGRSAGYFLPDTSGYGGAGIQLNFSDGRSIRYGMYRNVQAGWALGANEIFIAASLVSVGSNWYSFTLNPYTDYIAKWGAPASSVKLSSLVLFANCNSANADRINFDVLVINIVSCV